MPIMNRDDAAEVEAHITRIFAAPPQGRAAAVRAMFVEALDFGPVTGQVSLANPPANVQLPHSAERVAQLDGVNVLYLALDTAGTDRVRKEEAVAAAMRIEEQLGDNLVLVIANASAKQLHVIRPSFEGARPTLRRMIVERELPRRTVVQQLSNIYWNRRDRGSIRAALDLAFDVEAVTAQFFAEYNRVFKNTMEQVSGFGDHEVEPKKLFVQTLFNRLMFIYFLSRKGWLTFDGDKEYLDALRSDYEATDSEYKNFLIDRLRPLFFYGLNNLMAEDFTAEANMHTLIGIVPFLNGGLFDKTDEDERVYRKLDDPSRVVVPDECIWAIFDDLFDKFNFTVMESTPFDVEVAVDPEMLGKVFEELVTGRHESGSYYTPRPVVSFMCREALKGYLAGQDSGLDSAAIAAFVDQRDTEGIPVVQARRVVAALDQVTVVDPACGSGAYLLGMMQELIDLQAALLNAVKEPKALYDLKLEIIQRNLYGVDIDAFAVNIAMLRLWLSLAIEYEGAVPEPLPNLDFKIVRGDSLLGPDPSPSNYGDLFRHQVTTVASRLANLKAEHMRATDDKGALKAEIETLQDDLRQALADAPAPDEAVDWRVEFAEVFNSGGFDIAITNPPYVRQEGMGESKPALARQYADAATPRSDLYCYFYARALQLLKSGGMHVFVCSNSWLDVGYGAKLQEHLLKNAHVLAIYESAVERQFSTADINTIISLISKTPGGNESETRFVSLRGEFDAALADPEQRREIVRSQAAMRAGSMDGDKFVGDKWGGKYLRAPDIYHHLLNTYGDRLVRLGDIATVKRGITTGANKFFFLMPETIEEWGIESEFCSPVMTSPQESRRIAVDPDRLLQHLFMCRKSKEALEDTGALDYIRWGEAHGLHTRSSVRVRNRWYDLGKRDTAQIAMNYLMDTTGRTFFVRSGVHFGDNFQELRSNAASPIQLCTAMNATLTQLMFNISGRANFGGGLLKIQTFELANLEVVNPVMLPALDATLFDSAEWDVLKPSPERRQLDAAVFDALGLTQGERDAVYEGVWELVKNRRQKAASVS